MTTRTRWGMAAAGACASLVVAAYLANAAVQAVQLYDGASAGSAGQPGRETELAGVVAAVAVPVVLTLLALAGVAAARAWVHVGLRQEPPRRLARTTAAVFLVLTGLSIAGQLLGTWLADLWPFLDAPGGRLLQTGAELTSTWSVTGVAAGVITAGAAALTEEVCALAVPVWLVSRWSRWDERRDAPLLIACLAVLRVGYHAYLGPPALFYALWAVGTVWLYLRTRQLLPIVFAHFAFDVALALLHPLAMPSLWAWAAVYLLALPAPALLVLRATGGPTNPLVELGIGKPTDQSPLR